MDKQPFNEKNQPLIHATDKKNKENLLASKNFS